jgi:hypothetical protein
MLALIKLQTLMVLCFTFEIFNEISSLILLLEQRKNDCRVFGPTVSDEEKSFLTLTPGQFGMFSDEGNEFSPGANFIKSFFFLRRHCEWHKISQRLSPASF